MAKKILILTASPMRDEPIDNLLAEKLRTMGNDVETAIVPCLRGGRQAILEKKPNLVVLPPIRNPFSADMANTIKRFGCGVVTRHTEPSCDWNDFHKMTNPEKAAIYGVFPYQVDCELVWGPDEAQILNQRPNVPFKTFSVGSFSADIYKSEGVKCKTKEEILKQHNLDPNKRTILILSAWGFMDSGPDLHIDENTACSNDTAGRTMWLDMIRTVQIIFGTTHNILVTLHPNVDPKPYQELLGSLKLPLDLTNNTRNLVPACDLVIHAGSTVAMGAHFLNKPAIQYGDQNRKFGNWWNMPESAISQVSPYAPTVDKLIEMIKGVEFDKSNANPETLDRLEKGRYGCLDGHATDRSAQIINQIPGEFKYYWPDSPNDYSTPDIIRKVDQILQPCTCTICNRVFFVRKGYSGELHCAWCGSRIIRLTETPQ